MAYNPRIIPVLTITGQQLVKTLQFDNKKYVGDPINAIKIFNEKEVDELLILDIRASVDGKEPNYKLLREMAGEAFMPIGYGGGIASFEQAKRIFDCGVEKVILNTACKTNPNILTQIANQYGNQSVVASLDYKKNFLGKVRPVFQSGRMSMKMEVEDFAVQLENMGAGELILQSVERDGTFKGLDLEMSKKVASVVNIPVVPCGGAQSIQEMLKAVESTGASSAAAGSLFVFKNNNRDSILINYENRY